jgi:hypothetical protein
MFGKHDWGEREGVPPPNLSGIEGRQEGRA